MLSLGIIKLLREDILPAVNKQSVVCLARSGILPCNQEAVGNITNSQEFFITEGFKVYDDIDFVPDEGVTIVHDMNLPLLAVSEYDFVFECGTMEHIFDVAQVFKNTIQLCKVGGTVCHISPLTWLNHGFYNFSLTLFYDVYRNNGFDAFNFWLINWPKNYGEVGSSAATKIDFIPSQVIPPIGSDFLMVAFTAKKQDSKPFQNPIQAAYDPALALNTVLKNHGVSNE